MSTTLRIGYLKMLRRLGKKSLIAKSAFGYPYRISLGDMFSENPFYNTSMNVSEVIATAAWVMDKQHPIVFDIGGHCGFIASQVAHVLRKNAPVIYSFEPVGQTFSDLVQTVNELNLNQVIHPVSVALSSSTGFVKLNYSKQNSMLAQIIPVDSISNQRSGNEICYAPAQTLDEFCNLTKYPDVIKIDVEGWEVHVFEGAKALMKAAHSTAIGICIEWNPEAITQTGSSTSRLAELLVDYRFFYLNDYEGQRCNELDEIKDINGLTHVCNLFAIHKDHNGAEEWKQKFIALKSNYHVRTF